jgi:hypothetical protein
MAQVRALVQTFAGNILRKPGDVFEHDGEMGPGLELVNAKTNKAAAAAIKQAVADAVAKATALLKAADDAKEAVAADPTRNDLVTAALESEDAAADAEREATALQNVNTDDLV